MATRTVWVVYLEATGAGQGLFEGNRRRESGGSEDSRVFSATLLVSVSVSVSVCHSYADHVVLVCVLGTVMEPSVCSLKG